MMRVIGMLLLLAMSARSAVVYAQADVTGYETVTVSIPATGYDADAGETGSGKGVPQMARVKYNKTFPLVITSDDMGKTELTNNWAEVNGYPNINANVDVGIQPGGTDFLAAPYKKYYMQGESSNPEDYQPMTYTDNVGKTQRYRMTSAIMPYLLKSDGTSQYDKIDAYDAKLMLRTGWSFAQHDVDDISSVSAISAAMTANNTQWATKVGIGLKVMVEPNGNHNYLAAGSANSGICWNIFQNSTSEYPFQSKALNVWAATRSDWTSTGFGTMPTTFSSKPTGGYARTFFQGNESSWMSTVNSATGDNIVIGGTHGLGDEIKKHLRTANVTDKAWVGSADEVWEYYHIYNNLKIEKVVYSGGYLTFDVQVPTYNKNQYRELTLNIPGLTGTGAPTFSTASGKTVPVTGGYATDGGSGIGYTMNIGLETSITDHINQLMAIYRDDQTNEFVKRDLEYLISQLWDGTSYTSQLNATTKHDLTVGSSLDGTTGPTLATIKTDTDGSKSFAVPRYIVSGDKLYEVAANSSRPNYAQTITTTETPSAISYSEKSLSSLAVSANNFIPKAILVVEGEDMTGMTVLGADLDLAQTSHGRYWAMALGSGGMAGNLVSGNTATVTSALPRGKYKAVIGYGETYKSQGTYTYNLLVDGTQAATVSSSSATNNAVTELTTAEFDVTADGQAITLTTDNTNTGSRWIDYIYFVQTGSLEPQAPTAAIAASAGTTASIKTGNSITITANATQHGGSNYTGIKIYQCNDDAGTVSGDALATSNTEKVSYTFTPGSAGTYYFKAVANDATLNDGTSEVITVTVVDNIDTYTLNIIDKSGNVAMTTTVASGSLITDPLPNAYRSPFANNYKYYNTIAEAQANSGTNLTETSEWIQSTVYVGYDVKTDEFNANKKFAIYNVSNKYMHAVYRTIESHTYDNLWWLRGENLDAQNGNDGISAATLAFIDNSFMWYLGDDPYNIKIQGVGSGRYIDQSSTSNDGRIEHLATSEASATPFSIVYYGGNTTAGYYALYNRIQDKYVYYNGDNDGGWRLDPQREAGKLKITELPSLNINVIDNSGNTECTLHGYYKSGAAMPSFTPFFLTRTYTSNQRFYYDAACTDAITADGSTAVDADKIAASNYNVYMKYDLDTDWGTDNLFKVSNNTTQYWYAIRFCNTNNYLNAGTSDEHNIGSAGSNAETSTTANNSHWALFGSPYALKLVNRDSNNEGLFAAASMALTGNSAATAKMQTESNEFATVWEMRDINNTKINTNYRTKPALNPFGSFSGEAPYFFLYANSTSLNPTDNQNCRILQYDYKGSSTVAATLALSSTSNTTYVDQQVTLTATATPDGEKSVTYFAIEQETATDTWTVVGTAYSGTNAEGATKDENGVVTLTYPFTPSAEGLFNFRAKAIVDNNDASPLYSTDENQLSQQLTITASIKQLSPKNSSYTLTLIDKGGNELLTEASVPASRITTVNTLTNRNGDPFGNAYRSPLVTTYKYYEGTVAGKASAEAADDYNQVDWNTYTGTTVYVGYTVSDAIDLNGKDSNGNYKFSSLNNDANSLMQNRVHRDNNDANPLVRDASKFGKMYMLKFKTSAAYNLEDGSDNRNATATPANTLIYPYTNGDGPIYMYSHQRYLDQKDNGASTRTRWPWYLVSPKNDPYHVYITSWQSSHTDNTDNTNHYSYLRTYYNSTINQVVTNNVTDDDRTLEGGNGSQIMPTDYMILNGSGTDGLKYKLMTSSTITDASTTERRTVTSFEQYWRNNPTAQVASGGTKNSTVVETNNSTLIGFGWHNYKTWVNAANWTGAKYNINGKDYSKDYLYDDHWYMTVNVGDGSLDIVETNIDGVLVLLDNHGWEIMRQPIVEHDDDDYATVQEALRKYDSPMVKNYKFYSTRNVDHKVPGYHKYDITYLTSDKTKITGLTLVNSSETITSLANYPEVTSGGALTDLYVTYEVADDYANSYTGAATEAGTSASSFLLQQGSNYAKANSTAIESTSTVADADRWYLRPNFNIDAEMGYLYTTGSDGEKDKTTLETLYNTNSSNGFDPYNLQIQNVNSSTYFTTNASTAALNSGAWTGNGSSLSLAAVSTQITPTGYDNKTLAVTNATFMAVQDQYGNMRLMPRFQHEQVVDDFATLADPATLSAYDATNAQTTQLTTPVTYHIIDNSGNDALQMTVTDGVGLKVPDALKSPMVSAYQFHSTLAMPPMLPLVELATSP
ncbi:MAG: hypothetical protein II864_07370 [Prevotella sp.]|nr:hypothetical protein [Prevotella sp.]